MSATDDRIKAAAEEADREQAEELARIDAQAKQEQAEVEGKPTAEQPADQPVSEVTPQVSPAVTEPAPQPLTGQANVELEAIKAQLEVERREREQAEQRYRTAQGMLAKKESDELKALRAELEALKARPVEPAKPSEKPYLKYLTPEEKQALGPDGEPPLEIRVARGEIEASEERTKRLIAEAKKEAEESVLRQIAEERQQRDAALAEAQAKAKRSADNAVVFAATGKLEPAFLAINGKDPNFDKFLEMKDPKNVFGKTYGDRASLALFEGNAHGLAELTREYLALNPSGSRDAALAAQVRPDVSRATGQTGKPVPKPEHTLTEYEAFYKAKLKGEIPPNADGTPRTAAQVEAMQAELDDWYLMRQLANQ